MDSNIRKYCEHIMNTHKKTIKYDKKKNVWYWDYPNVASICYNSSKKIHRPGFSHYGLKTKWAPIFITEFKKLGVLGKGSIHDKNPIGNCAEQHSANNLIRVCNIKKLNHLYFSESVRPRTMEIYAPCNNCRFLFPNI